MSKNVSIEEGDRARNFGPTAKIKTELQQGGYCYWVPEDERETGMVFASTNRKYTPDAIGKYGIDEIDINIIFTGVDPDGNPWIVTIDPDIELPTIIYPPDDEIDIDPETGLPIPPIPPIKIPGIVIEIDPDTGDVIIEEIPDPDKDPDDWPGWDDIDPSIKEDFDDWIDDGNDPDDWPGWDDIDPSIKEDFDDWMGDLDPVPIADIDDSILGDMGFDPESDIDFSIDDLGDIDDPGSIGIVGDIDGIPSIVDLDLDDMEWDKQDCPKSIYVLSRPAGIVYTDGDTIDFTGLSIAALDKDGMDWPDPSVFTPIPASEISMPTPTANISDASGKQAIVNGDIPVFEVPMAPENPDSGGSGGVSGWSTGGTIYIFNRLCNIYLEIWNGNAGPISGGSMYVNKDSNGVFSYKPSVPGTNIREVARYADTGEFAGFDWPKVSYSSLPAPESNRPIAEEDIESVDTKEAIVPVKVQWTSPCFETLETTFDITVYPKTDHGGSHHSGKF